MKQGLTKNDSLAIKGLAILMLLFHHLFLNANNLKKFDVDLYPFTQSFVVNTAMLFKACVGIFAFITGYGLFKSILKINLKSVEVAKWNAVRLVKTMSGFWFVYVISFAVTMYLDKLPKTTYFEKSTFSGIFYIINDFLGLANFFNTPTLNKTWWYMSAAIIFVLIIPAVYIISRKIGYLPIVIVIAALPRLFNLGYLGASNTYVFILPVVFGMIFADYDLFNKIETKLPKNKILSYVICFGLFGAAICVGYIAVTDYDRKVAWEFNYAVIPVVFICFFRYCIVRIPIIKNVLKFIGTHSMTIFLTHTFIRYNYLADVVYSFGHFLLIYVVFFAMSLVLAMVIDIIKKLCCYDKLISKMTTKIQTL